MSSHTRPFRVLVTGAGGFVGRWLMKDLAERLPPGSDVIAAGHREADPLSSGSHIFFDICDPEAVDAAVKQIAPTCVVHLAGITTLEEARLDVRRAWTTNLFGTMNLAEAVRQHAPEARFVFVSTSETYGASFNGHTTPVPEDTPLHPTSVYGATKAAAEQMLGQMAYNGLDVVRLRPFNHTGPGQTRRFVVPAFAAQIVAIERGRTPPVIKVGNLFAHRDFLDVRDIVKAYGLAITREDLPRAVILNLASGRSQKIGAVLEALLAMARVPIAVEIDQARLRPNDIPFAAGDARRAGEVLGWHPTIPWETTLHDILEEQRRADA